MISPCVLKNVSSGTHLIELIYFDKKYTEMVEVKEYQKTEINIEIDYQTKLVKISVLPPITHITLSLGNTSSIISVTAYYSNNSSKSVPLSNCTYSSSDKTFATVNSKGTITGISAGTVIITVSYTEGEVTKTDNILVYIRNTPTDTPIIPPVQDNITYRALLVGVGDYMYLPNDITYDLDAPPYDVDRMEQILDKCRFGSSEIKFISINELKDLNATKSTILNGIASTFSGADDNDISYF